MRAIWSGAIGFGLVNIPIKMYGAVEDSKLDLDMLDKHDNSNIRFQRVNEKTGEEVAWGDIVKGYKLNNKYVILSDKDFEMASPKKSQVIEIDSFVDEKQVDGAYFETPYYLAPDEGGDKAYLLLRDALDKSGKAAIGTYVMRGREHLCMLRAHGDVLMLMRLRWAEEIRPTTDLDIPSKASVKATEMKMALTLIEQLTEEKFSISKYKDTYDAELLKLIKKKARGKEFKEPEFKLVKSKSQDLMAQLKASLEGKSTTKQKKAS